MYKAFEKNHEKEKGKGLFLKFKNYLKKSIYTTLHYTTTIILLNYYLTTTYFVTANEKPFQMFQGGLR